MSELVAWLLVVCFSWLAWHNYERWQFWADEWLAEYKRGR